MSHLKKLNLTGLCTLCEEPIYKITKTYPLDHELAGEAVAVGKPLGSLRYVTLVLINGNTCRITMCDKCVEVHEELWINRVWENLLNTWKREMSDHWRELIGAKVTTPEQKETQKKNLQYLVHNVAVGVINVAEHGE